MSGLAAWVGFFLMTWPGNLQDVVSSFAQLSFPFRRLQAFAASAENVANFPIFRTIRALYFGEKISHNSKYSVLLRAGGQLLRLFRWTD